MNPETTEKTRLAFRHQFCGGLFAVRVLAVVVRFAVSVPAVDADRAALRSKALADIRAAEATALTTPDWVDKDRGIVRLPIETALQLSQAAAQNPAAARADLMARAAKAAAPLPKTAPKPSAFE